MTPADRQPDRERVEMVANSWHGLVTRMVRAWDEASTSDEEGLLMAVDPNAMRALWQAVEDVMNEARDVIESGCCPRPRGGRMSKYPKGAIHEAIDALELAYSYLRDKPVIEEKLTNALHRLYRVREIEEGVPHPYARVGGDG